MNIIKLLSRLLPAPYEPPDRWFRFRTIHDGQYTLVASDQQLYQAVQPYLCRDALASLFGRKLPPCIVLGVSLRPRKRAIHVKVLSGDAFYGAQVTGSRGARTVTRSLYRVTYELLEELGGEVWVTLEPRIPETLSIKIPEPVAA